MDTKIKIKIESVKDTNTTVISLGGHLDISMANAINKRIDDVFKTNPMKIIFDLKGLTYISSAGLRILLYVAKKMTAKEGEVALCSVNDSIQKILDISGMTKFLPVYVDRTAVLTS